MYFVPVPLNVTVFVPGVKVPPLFVQFPFAVMLVPAVNVPPVSVAFPLIVNVGGAIKLPEI